MLARWNLNRRFLGLASLANYANNFITQSQQEVWLSCILFSCVISPKCGACVRTRLKGLIAEPTRWLICNILPLPNRARHFPPPSKRRALLSSLFWRVSLFVCLFASLSSSCQSSSIHLITEESWGNAWRDHSCLAKGVTAGQSLKKESHFSSIVFGLRRRASKGNI